MHNYITRYLARRLVPTMLGFDPLLAVRARGRRHRRVQARHLSRRPGHLQHRRRRRAPALDGHQARRATRHAGAPSALPAAGRHALGRHSSPMRRPRSSITCAISASPTARRRPARWAFAPAYTTREALLDYHERAAAARREPPSRNTRVAHQPRKEIATNESWRPASHPRRRHPGHRGNAADGVSHGPIAASPPVARSPLRSRCEPRAARRRSARDGGE